MMSKSVLSLILVLVGLGLIVLLYPFLPAVGFVLGTILAVIGLSVVDPDSPTVGTKDDSWEGESQ